MEPKMNIKKSEEFRSFYSNQVNIHSSFFDFVIDFGEVEKIEMQGNQPIMNVEVKARVVMSPQHAKAFLQALSKNIESY